MSSASTEVYVILEHDIGRPFDPPDPAAQVVKSCGYVQRLRACENGWAPEAVTRALVLWVYPRRT